MRNEKKQNKSEGRATLVNRLYLYATKYKGDPQAAEALMSFFAGECNHLSDNAGKCQLCGHQHPEKTRN